MQQEFCRFPGNRARAIIVNRILTIPNLLTVLRLLSLPAVIALFRTGHSIAAAMVFVMAMLTDCIDGWLARRLRQDSLLGLYLDPVVDKIILLALFYELAHAGLVAWPVAHLFLARELLQNAVRSVAASQGTVVGANWMGKTKATLQTILITWGLCLPTLSGPGQAMLGRALAASAWMVLGMSWLFFAAFVARNRRAPGAASPHSTRGVGGDQDE